MHLKSILVLLLFILIGNNNDEATMSWNETKKLTWADFQSTPDNNSEAVALTASGITFGYSLKTTSNNRIVDFSVSVESHFYPKKSWYLKDRANNYILAHEQLHFDITELYARRFRKELTKVKVNQNLKKQLRALHKSINKSLNETQKKYDAESNHSINVDIQKQWEVLIHSELKKLDQYKSE